MASKLKKTGLLFVLPLVLQACTNALTISGDFPEPLIQPVPASAGVYYDDEFRNYTYTEKSKDRGKWIIDTGNAQVKLFNSVLPRMFTQLQEVKALPDIDNPSSSDLVLQPKLLEFQYSVPRETRFKVYEVWMKFNISAYDSRGSLFADWIITAYGKTPSAFMQSQEKAMNAAAIVALRDLGANLSLTTLRVPEMRNWLQVHKYLPATPQATPAPVSDAPATQSQELQQ